MNLFTLFDIGEVRYAPRVYDKYEEHKIVVDGLEYSRDVFTLEPVVKAKKIVDIDINISAGGVKIDYWMCGVGSREEYTNRYSEEELNLHMYSSSDAAQSKAQSLLEEGKPYYGGGG